MLLEISMGELCICIYEILYLNVMYMKSKNYKMAINKT